MAEAERLRKAFRVARTQVLGISVDSVHSHSNWARHLGGVSFPLLADFHPKGAVGERFGLYLAASGVDDRATVLIDAAGVVRWRESVTPSGARDVSQLLQRCRSLDSTFDGPVDEPVSPGLPGDAELFVRSDCGASEAVLVAAENLHLAGSIRTVNVSRSEQERRRLVRLAGRDQVPCLRLGDELLHEAQAITSCLAQFVAAVASSPLATAGGLHGRLHAQ